MTQYYEVISAKVQANDGEEKLAQQKWFYYDFKTFHFEKVAAHCYRINNHLSGIT